MKRKPIPQNKFEVIASRVMKCRVREEVKMRRQEMVEEEEVRYFRCWGIGHYKWECPNIEVERRQQEEEAVYVVKPQKAQQEEKRLVCPLWKKAQKYSGIWGMPLRGTALEEKGWKTKWEVVTFVECGGCNYKGTKTEENQEYGFVSGERLKNI